MINCAVMIMDHSANVPDFPKLLKNIWFCKRHIDSKNQREQYRRQRLSDGTREYAIEVGPHVKHECDVDRYGVNAKV